MAIIKSTDKTFKNIIKENKLVLVDFCAPFFGMVRAILAKHKVFFS